MQVGFSIFMGQWADFDLNVLVPGKSTGISSVNTSIIAADERVEFRTAHTRSDDKHIARTGHRFLILTAVIGVPWT